MSEMKDGDLLRIMSGDGAVMAQGIVVDHLADDEDGSFSFRLIQDPEPEAEHFGEEWR
jgi:hypothetical protein